MDATRQPSDLSRDDAYLVHAMLAEAVIRAGGARALGRQLDWSVGAMGRVRSGKEKISPFRAARLCEYLGLEPRLGAVAALRSGAKSEAERLYWDQLFQSDLIQFELLTLSRIVRHAETKANSAGADAEKYKRAAKEAREAIAEAVAAGAKLPPAMDGNY